MRNNKKLLFFSIYYILYGALVTRFVYSNQLLTLIPDMIVVYLTFFRKVPKSYAIHNYTGKLLGFLLLCFLGLGIFTALRNNMPPMSTIWGTRMFLRYSLLLYLVYHYFDYSDILKCKKIFYQSFYFNLLFCIIERARGQIGDFMGGIQQGNGDLAIYLVICLLMFSLDYFNKELSLKKFIFCVVISFMEAMWAEVKFLYFLIPLCLYGTYVLYKKFSITHIIVLVLSFFFLVPALRLILSSYYGDTYINDVFDQDQIEKYTTGSNYGFNENSFNRSTCIEMTNMYYLTDYDHLLFGYGIGSGTVSSNFSTWLLNAIEGTNYFYFTSSYVLIEMGWVGYTLFIVGHILLLWKFILLYMRSRSKIEKYWTTFSLLLVAITFLFMWYNALPYTLWYLPYLVWGMCYVVLRELKRANIIALTQTNTSCR